MLTYLTSTIDSRPLGLARIVVGGAALIRLIVATRVLGSLTRPEILHAPYLDWLPRPSVPVVAGILIVWAVSGLLFTLGWRVSLSGPALLMAISLTLAIDLQAYSNHLYLMAWLVLLMVLADAGAGLSIGNPDRTIVRWPVILIMIQISLVYGFSALTKLGTDFLSGRVLAGVIGGGLLPLPEMLRIPEFLSPLAALAVLVEVFLALFLWVHRFRPAAFVLGFGLHASITLFMASTLELLVFSLLMLAVYPLFLTQERLVLTWDKGCERCRVWIRRLERLDLLHTLETIEISENTEGGMPSPDSMPLQLMHHGKTTRDFAAVVRTLEHLVPTLWVAPILRIPGIHDLGRRWYRRRIQPRSLRDDTAEV